MKLTLPSAGVLCACLALLVVFSTPFVAAQSPMAIVGSGSNVPNHLYLAWIDEYNKTNSRVQVRYLALGTSESIHQVSQGSGDFGGGEIPLSRDEMRGGKVALVQIPTVLVGIVPVYNLPGNPEINFSGEVLAGIYLGKIRSWRDPHVVKLNPGINLPDLPISVVHRTAGKGSNYIFTDFLSKTSPDFRTQVGKSASPNWPLGAEANRGEDMVEKVAATAGAIGYVELNFAKRPNIGYGSVLNPAGQFVRATPATISAACAAMEKSIPEDFHISLTNAPGKDSYPLASFTWLYLPVNAPADRRVALEQFLSWTLKGGQDMARNLGYATLPSEIIARAQATLEGLQHASAGR